MSDQKDKSLIDLFSTSDVELESEKHGHHQVRRSRCRDMVLYMLILGLMVLQAATIVWFYQRNQDLKEKVDSLSRERHEVVPPERIVQTTRSPARDISYLIKDAGDQDHGISTSNIAYLYGDKDGIEKYVKNHDGELYFRKNTSYTGDEFCARGIENGRRDTWCPTREMFMIRKRNANTHTFEYFTQAHWMNNDDTKKNFDVLPEGKIQVKTNGTFIIQAQAFFYSTNAASIRVIRETQDGEKSVITACFLKTSDVDKTDWTLPCNVFNVVGLEADDKVYLDMQSYAFFRVRREALHFTVIKLNSQSIATEAAAGS